MQTSCGSPCYAAPELVISEGMYVGSAVDIWSCGVILYAMLAGYLPFDDDPANPDGDNINLLYKYIINTQLTFPDYVSAEARDLLGMMLVPDPSRRCDLESIKRHPWLSSYRGLFEKSVDDLEEQAMEMQNAKRLQYQKMMRQREKESTHVKMSRTQSARMDTGSVSGGNNMGLSSSASTRTTTTTRTAQPQHEFLYETGGADLVPPTTGRRVVASAIIPTSHAAAYDDDPFGASKPPMPQSSEGATPSRKSSASKQKSAHKSPSKTSGPPPSQSPQTQKKKGGYRHTLQVEYDDGESSQPPAPPMVNGHSAPMPTAPTAAYDSSDHFVSSPMTMSPPEPLLPPAHVPEPVKTNGATPAEAAVPEGIPAKEDEVVANGDGQDTPKKPSRDSASAATPKAKTIPSSISITEQPVPEPLPSPTTPRGVSKEAPSSPSPAPKPKRADSVGPSLHTSGDEASAVGSTEGPAPTVLPTPSITSNEAETVASTGPASTTSSAISVPQSTSANSQKSRTRHRKGLSLDKFNPTNLFGGSKETPVEKYGGGSKPPTTGPKPKEAPPSAFDPKGVPASSSTTSAASETASTKSKASKRKTFTLMMGEQFGTAK